MATEEFTGVETGGKPINLAQLQAELATAGLDVPEGLGMADDARIFTYDRGSPVDFDPANVPLIQSAIDSHVALREKTDEEYSTEFRDVRTTPGRRLEINNIITGLLPREQVPM